MILEIALGVALGIVLGFGILWLLFWAKNNASKALGWLIGLVGFALVIANGALTVINKGLIFHPVLHLGILILSIAMLFGASNLVDD